MIWVFLILGWAIALPSCLLLLRATRRLLEFDELFGGLVDTLGGYADDLRKMSSGGVLLDHPEIVKFHNRNLQALREVDAIVQQVRGLGAPEEPQGPLPRPDVE